MKRDQLYREPLMPRKWSVEEILKPNKTKEEEMGIQQAYDDTARAFARVILECAERHPGKWEKVYNEIDLSKKWRLMPSAQWEGKGGGEDHFLEALKNFEENVADETYKELANQLGPSMLQAGWAFQVVYIIWKEEKGRE